MTIETAVYITLSFMLYLFILGLTVDTVARVLGSVYGTLVGWFIVITTIVYIFGNIIK